MSEFTQRRTAAQIQERLDAKTKDFEHLAFLAREALDSVFSAGDLASGEVHDLAAWLLVNTEHTPNVACYPDERPKAVK